MTPPADLANVLDAIRAAGAADHWHLADEIATEHEIRACRMCLAKRLRAFPKQRQWLEHPATRAVAAWFCTRCLDKYIKQQERRGYTVKIYARPNGSDTTGDGTLANPYRTFQRAGRDIPTMIPRGVKYELDITGVTAQ